MAARGGGLQVKLYETIQPRMVHFLLDAASLLQKDAGVLEEAISLVASLIVKLESSGIHCGLSLPATDLQDEINLYPNEQTTKDSLLFCLARFEWAEEIHPLSPDNLAGSREQMGQGYLVTYRVPRSILFCPCWNRWAAWVSPYSVGKTVALSAIFGFAVCRI